MAVVAAVMAPTARFFGAMAFAWALVFGALAYGVGSCESRSAAGIAGSLLLMAAGYAILTERSWQYRSAASVAVVIALAIGSLPIMALNSGQHPGGNVRPPEGSVSSESSNHPPGVQLSGSPR